MRLSCGLSLFQDFYYYYFHHHRHHFLHVASLSCRVLHNIYVRISRLHSNDSETVKDERQQQPAVL